MASMVPSLTSIQLLERYAEREMYGCGYFTDDDFKDNHIVHLYLTCDLASMENSFWAAVRIRWCLGQKVTFSFSPGGTRFEPPIRYAAIYYFCVPASASPGLCSVLSVI